MEGKERPIFFEILEPRILLSADGLLNSALNNQDQDILPNHTDEIVQYAELSDINEHSEEQITQKLDTLNTNKSDICQPIFTLFVDDNTNDGTGSGTFSSNLSGLIPNTTYYVRAYATNNTGTAYGNEIMFKTLQASFSCGNDFTDPRDNKVYGTVLIGLQCWFSENINVGSQINSSLTQVNNSTIEKYCFNLVF